MMRKNRAQRGYKYLLQILNQRVYLCDWKRGSFNGVSEDVCNGGSDRRGNSRTNKNYLVNKGEMVRLTL